MLEVALSGAVIAKFIEWLKYKKWFPVNYNETALLRFCNVAFAVLMALFIGFVGHNLDFTTIEGIRAFLQSVVGLVGSEYVFYAGFVKKSPEEKQEAYRLMLNS